MRFNYNFDEKKLIRINTLMGTLMDANRNANGR
jgi:hypothetical protein